MLRQKIGKSSPSSGENVPTLASLKEKPNYFLLNHGSKKKGILTWIFVSLYQIQPFAPPYLVADVQAKWGLYLLVQQEAKSMAPKLATSKVRAVSKGPHI